MKKLMLLIVILIFSVLSPFAGKNNTLEKKNKQIAENNFKNRQKDPAAQIKLFSDSVCRAVGVPPKLVREIGQNESGWRCIRSLSGGTDYGDLQIVKPTFDFWYNKLELTGGGTRENYLIVGINYLKYLEQRYGSWKKARFAYARGHWRNRSTWTALETRFMNKINWKQYDS